MACSHTQGCALFPLFSSSKVLEIWKRMYCETPAHDTCARFKLSLEMKPVPIDLLPNGASLAGASLVGLKHSGDSEQK